MLESYDACVGYFGSQVSAPPGRWCKQYVLLPLLSGTPCTSKNGSYGKNYSYY